MTDLLRPIAGIENRTAQEVFDIMCDRFRHQPNAGEDALRAALWPFASVLSDYDPSDEDDGTPATLVVGSVTEYSLILGDFRDAARALYPRKTKS